MSYLKPVSCLFSGYCVCDHYDHDVMSVCGCDRFLACSKVCDWYLKPVSVSSLVVVESVLRV